MVVICDRPFPIQRHGRGVASAAPTPTRPSTRSTRKDGGSPQVTDLALVGHRPRRRKGYDLGGRPRRLVDAGRARASRGVGLGVGPCLPGGPGALPAPIPRGLRLPRRGGSSTASASRSRFAAGTPRPSSEPTSSTARPSGATGTKIRFLVRLAAGAHVVLVKEGRCTAADLIELHDILPVWDCRGTLAVHGKSGGTWILLPLKAALCRAHRRPSCRRSDCCCLISWSGASST